MRGRACAFFSSVLGRWVLMLILGFTREVGRFRLQALVEHIELLLPI